MLANVGRRQPARGAHQTRSLGTPTLLVSSSAEVPAVVGLVRFTCATSCHFVAEGCEQARPPGRSPAMVAAGRKSLPGLQFRLRGWAGFVLSRGPGFAKIPPFGPPAHGCFPLSLPRGFPRACRACPLALARLLASQPTGAGSQRTMHTPGGQGGRLRWERTPGRCRRRPQGERVVRQRALASMLWPAGVRARYRASARVTTWGQGRGCLAQDSRKV